MPKHLSQDLRECIIVWRELYGMSVAAICNLSGLKKTMVYTLLACHTTHGTVKNSLARKRGRPCALNNGDRRFIRALIQARPSVFLDEIQVELYDPRRKYVSAATISRELHWMSLRNKAVAAEALERNKYLRAIWQCIFGQYTQRQIVCLDESAVNNTANHRRRGWAELGRPCVCRLSFLRGIQYSVLPALTVDGMMALDMFEGFVTKERFMAFLSEQIVPLLNPFPMDRSVVVMDNCSIHHDEDIRQLIESTGARLVYLPPYSPDFNPIEQAFLFRPGCVVMRPRHVTPKFGHG